MTTRSTLAYHPSVPLHHQIQRVLRSKIETGEWSSEEKLPTEMELARRFRVSRNTIREALSSLEHDGLIVRHRRRGTFVQLTRAPADSRTTITNLLLGYRAKVSVIRAVTAPAPAHVVPFLRIPRGQPVRQFVRTESVEGVTFNVVINYMILAIGRRIGAKDLRRYSMLEFLRDHLKIPLGEVQQSIEARMPDEEAASLLGIDLTQPVLFRRAMVSDKHGHPIEVADNFYRADRYHYEVKLPLLSARRARQAR